MYHAVETRISVFKIQSGNAIKKKNIQRRSERDTEKGGDSER